LDDASRRSKRRRGFNVAELKRLAATAINRNADEVARFEKLAEGGFNRTFLITMHDGFQFVGRIPYPVTEPKQSVVASEVATMEFLRSHGIPVPKIYDYSATSENLAGTEYLFMELVRGTNLGDIWFELSEKARITAVTKLVELETRLFALPFPASGSLYYAKDL
jgi:predicted Ser/Thr protein kinase